MARRFSGVISLEGVETGDGRFWVPGAFTWADLPIPLGFLPTDMHGDGGAGGPSVGSLETLSRVGNEIVGTGVIDDETPEGADIVRRLDAGLAPFGDSWGISVDLDDVELEIVAKKLEEEEIVLLASAMPGMTMSLTAAAGDPDTDGEVVATDSSDAVVLRFLRSRIRGATLVNMPAFDGARITLDVMDAPPGELPEEQPTEPLPEDEEAMVVTASVFAQGMIVTHDGEPILASGFPIAPPVAWFDNPGFDRPHPFTVDENGRVYGHIATFDRCFVGMEGCTIAPHTSRNYDLFLTGEMRCAEGCSVRVGTITANTGHPSRRLGHDASVRHYADTGLAGAYVALGEDAFGIWAAGTARPDLTDAQLVNLRAGKPSGDWRPMNGGHELIAVLMVNTPGFPVVRDAIAASAVPQEVLDMAAERIDKRFVKGLDRRVADENGTGWGMIAHLAE